MKIEVGKFYRDRAGRKVRVYATDAGGDMSIHAAKLEDDGAWYFCSLRAHGNVFEETRAISDDDIISEWEEPKPRMLAYRATSSIHNKNSPWVLVLASGGVEQYRGNGWIYERAPHLDEPEQK